MSALRMTVADSTVMVRRNVRRLKRYPSMTLMLIGMPVVFLLLFVYVFGGQLGDGLDRTGPLAHVSSSRAAYLDYVTPGVLMVAIAAAVQGTAITVAMDMTGGIVDRFRTMAIARASVLGGHVIATMVQTLLSVAIVLGIAILLGFRPHASLPGWLGAAGIVVLFAFSLIWLAVALGLAARSVETASNTPMFLTLLPLLGSGFIVTATLPDGLRQFAEYQPFTPVTDTVRDLLTGVHPGSHLIVAIAWSVGITIGSYLWARRLYERPRPVS